MATSDLLRHQKINSLMAQPPEKVADAAIDLWGKMAIQIISIVGEGGFNSLYARSVFLTQASFPWLSAVDPTSRQDRGFANESPPGRTTVACGNTGHPASGA